MGLETVKPTGKEEEERVGLADLLTDAGRSPDQPGESTGVVYWSDEEFLAYLDAQPYELLDS